MPCASVCGRNWKTPTRTEIKLARAQLNQTYDRFVARFGPVSDRVNALAFRGDPDLPLLFSLENYDSEINKATKTAIFRERTIQKQKPITVGSISKGSRHCFAE